ncbi:unnamed protein product [Chrysodeixis includens]|uniref:Uncharacterized protein n=1 Tax=Chrysodeixis includens TaxID=689277 RepID=A0A9P0G1M0_CHRIL|nr:unnamed protein product [Chrysodeixis includens]
MCTCQFSRIAKSRLFLNRLLLHTTLFGCYTTLTCVLTKPLRIGAVTKMFLYFTAIVFKWIEIIFADISVAGTSSDKIEDKMYSFRYSVYNINLDYSIKYFLLMSNYIKTYIG